MLTAIVQARTGSTRLPGKVLKTIQGKTLLELFVNRVRPCKSIKQLVIATTELPADDAIEALAHQIGVPCFRGSEMDLLDRYYQCAKAYGADPVLRITPDNPFVDHTVIDRGAEIFQQSEVDFVTNHFDPTYPEGLDIEIYSFRALETSWKEAELLSEREHVFPYIHNNQDRFKVINFQQDQNVSHLRWTLDYPCDFEMTQKIYEHLYAKNPIFLQDEILALLKVHPELSELNAHIPRKEGVNKTKREDAIQPS